MLMSDHARCPDWRAALHHGGPHCGLILRDYEVPARAALARDMAAFCATQGRFFAIAGDWRLARRFGAALHCPSYLIPRAVARGSVSGRDTAAIHNLRELHQAAKAGFRTVLVSPVFASQSHPGGRGLGVTRARALARAARQLGLSPRALGGLSPAALRRLNGTAPIFDGFAAIDAFAG